MKQPVCRITALLKSYVADKWQVLNREGLLNDLRQNLLTYEDFNRAIYPCSIDIEHRLPVHIESRTSTTCSPCPLQSLWRSGEVAFEAVS